MVVLVEKLNGTFNCPLKNLGIMVNVVETGGTPADIMMVSKSFEIEFFELIDVFIFDFIMSVFLCSVILLMKVLLLAKYCSCSKFF